MLLASEDIKQKQNERQRPFSPSVPAEAGCLFIVAACVHVFISVDSLHCFLVGWCTNKSYVIATSDLRLFIHASNLLPSTPHPTPLHIVRTRITGFLMFVLHCIDTASDSFGKTRESVTRKDICASSDSD